MIRLTVPLALLIVSGAVANGPPPLDSYRPWRAVFEFPHNNGVKWTLSCRQPRGGGTRHWLPTMTDGKRAITVVSPDDFAGEDSRPSRRFTLEAVSAQGETRTLELTVPSPVVGYFTTRRTDFISQKVEWAQDGIRLTVLKEIQEPEWRAVTIAYIFGGVAVVYAAGLWLFARRRHRLTRTGRPPGR